MVLVISVQRQPVRQGKRTEEGESGDRKQPGSTAEVAVEKAEKGRGERGGGCHKRETATLPDKMSCTEIKLANKTVKDSHTFNAWCV